MKILNHLLYTSDLAVALIAQDFIPILVDIIGISDPEVHKYGFRILAVTSLREEYTLKVFDSDVMHVLCAIIFNERLSTLVALDAARFLTKISSTESKSLAKRLLSDGIPSALAELCKSDYDPAVRVVAIRGLQNMFIYKDIALNFVDSITEIVFSVLKATEDIAAAMCIYNLSRFEACVSKLVYKRAHVSLLETMCIVHRPASKSACLQALTLFSGNSECINDLLGASLITRLYDQILSADKSTWEDVTLMLLSVVVNRSDLSDEEHRGIERILEYICKRNVSTAQVILQSIRVIAFLSANTQNFAALDPIIRLILSMTDSEAVIESASVALYNFSCKTNGIKILLQDDIYLHMMIRMMRNSKLEIQVVIAETLRTMCSVKECVQLLLKGDIMSDLIAIALLRTSSVEVKICCCQAFYNVFCNPSSRMKQLEGDLWWSMMRLARAESNYTIRKTCADALFQLTSEGRLYAEVLHNSNIFSFVKDVIGDADEELMSSYILSLQYLMEEFYGPISGSEICCTLEVVNHCLVNSKSDAVILGSVRLLLKASSSCQLGSEGDFLKFGVMSALFQSFDAWFSNDEALCNVSQCLSYLTKFAVFLKATSISEIGDFLFNIYSNSNGVKILDHSAQIFSNYVAEKAITAAELVKLPVWFSIVKDAIYYDNHSRSSKLSRSIIISIYADYFLAFRSCDEMVQVDVFDGIFREPVIKGSKTLRNIAHIIGLCVDDPDLSLKIIDSGVVQFLWTVVNAKADILEGESSTHYLEFCSEVLRNLMQHKHVVSKLVLCKNLRSLLYACAETTRRSILYNICGTLYKTLDVTVPIERLPIAADDSIISEDITEICSLICDKTTDKQVIHMARYIAGINLDKYKVQDGCKPAVVLSMFTEMNDKESANIPTLLSMINGKKIDLVHAVTFSFHMDHDPEILFSKPNVSNAIWIPVVIQQCKKLEGVVQGMNNPDAIRMNSFDNFDPLPLSQYQKVLKQYPLSVLTKNDLPFEDEEYDNDEFDGDTTNKLGREPICLSCDQRYATYRCLNCEPTICLYCSECVDKHNKNPDYGAHVLKDWSKDIANSTPAVEINEKGIYDIPASLMGAFTGAEILFFRHHFMEIDKDHGGSIDAEELQSLTEAVGNKITIEHANRLISDFDADGSGAIDYEEFVRLMLSIRSGDGSTEDNELVTAIYQSRVKFAREAATRRGSIVSTNSTRQSFEGGVNRTSFEL